MSDMSNFNKVKTFMSTYGQDVKEKASFPEKKIVQKTFGSKILKPLSVRTSDILRHSQDEDLTSQIHGSKEFKL